MHFYFKIKKNFKNVLHIWHIHAQTYRTVTIYPTFHLHSYLAVKGWGPWIRAPALFELRLRAFPWVWKFIFLRHFLNKKCSYR